MKIMINSNPFHHDGELAMAFDCAYRNAAQKGHFELTVNSHTLATGVEVDIFVDEIAALALAAPKGSVVQRGAKKILRSLAVAGMNVLATDIMAAASDPDLGA